MNLYEVGYDGLGVFDIIGDGDNDAKSGLAPSSEVEPSMSSESNSMLQNVKNYDQKSSLKFKINLLTNDKWNNALFDILPV